MDSTKLSLVILAPVFNDWEAASILIEELDRALALKRVDVRVVLLDDGSTTPPLKTRGHSSFRALQQVEVLHLRKNLGHQRAIAVGLTHVYDYCPCDAVLVMDADGEDRPEDIPALLLKFEQFGREQIIFAARTKRMESLTFQFFYQVYRGLHHGLTGIPVRVGNFSILPWEVVNRLMVVSDLWNHYAAAIFRARLPFQTVPLARGRRYAGESRMSFFALLVHGLSAISVFADVVSARLLAGSGALIVALLATAVWFRHAPGWPTFTAGLLIVLLAQTTLFSTLLVLLIMGKRSGANFLPIRDAHFYRLKVTALYSAQESAPKSKDTSAVARTTHREVAEMLERKAP